MDKHEEKHRYRRNEVLTGNAANMIFPKVTATRLIGLNESAAIQKFRNPPWIRRRMAFLKNQMK